MDTWDLVELKYFQVAASLCLRLPTVPLSFGLRKKNTNLFRTSHFSSSSWLEKKRATGAAIDWIYYFFLSDLDVNG